MEDPNPNAKFQKEGGLAQNMEHTNGQVTARDAANKTHLN